MFNFIKRLFTGLDRSEAAADRIALATEGIADDLEAVRAQMRRRLGLDDVNELLESPANGRRKLAAK